MIAAWLRSSGTSAAVVSSSDALDPGNMGKEFETLEPSFVKTVFAKREPQAAARRHPLQCRPRRSRHRARGGYEAFGRRYSAATR